MKIDKPLKTVHSTTGWHQCPGCLLWYVPKAMRAVAWRRAKIGRYTETVEVCSNCLDKRHEEETGERLIYRMREIRLGTKIANNRGGF